MYILFIPIMCLYVRILLQNLNICFPFSAAMQKANFFATQFHPEKSGDPGEKILSNFLEAMIQIIPAIDIIEGKCVRLTQGDYQRKQGVW